MNFPGQFKLNEVYYIKYRTNGDSSQYFPVVSYVTEVLIGPCYAQFEDIYVTYDEPMSWGVTPADEGIQSIEYLCMLDELPQLYPEYLL